MYIRIMKIESKIQNAALMCIYIYTPLRHTLDRSCKHVVSGYN